MFYFGGSGRKLEESVVCFLRVDIDRPTARRTAELNAGAAQLALACAATCRNITIEDRTERPATFLWPFPGQNLTAALRVEKRPERSYPAIVNGDICRAARGIWVATGSKPLDVCKASYTLAAQLAGDVAIF